MEYAHHILGQRSEYSWHMLRMETGTATWEDLVNKHGICLEYAWNMLGISLVCAWNMFGICLEYIWNKLGICLEYAWNKLGMCSEYAWNKLGICLEYAWHMLLIPCVLSQAALQHEKTRKWKRRLTNA